MKYCQINRCSITDGPGIRISLYVSGCRNNCPGCHNKEAQDFNFGKPYTEETASKIISLMADPHVDGLTLVGGEPMEPENQLELKNLCERVKILYPNKTIWCYTGYELSDLIPGGKKHIDNVTNEFLNTIDVIVTGRFILKLRDISDNNRWRGSTNQRVIDLQKSLKTNDNTIIYVKNIPNND